MHYAYQQPGLRTPSQRRTGPAGEPGKEFCARRNTLVASEWPPLALPSLLRAASPAPLMALRPRVVLIICTWSRPPDFARYRAASAVAISSEY